MITISDKSITHILKITLRILRRNCILRLRLDNNNKINQRTFHQPQKLENRCLFFPINYCGICVNLCEHFQNVITEVKGLCTNIHFGHTNSH